MPIQWTDDLEKKKVLTSSEIIIISYYFQFPNLKKWPGDEKLGSNADFIAQTNFFYADIDKPFLFGECQGFAEALIEVYVA